MLTGFSIMWFPIPAFQAETIARAAFATRDRRARPPAARRGGGGSGRGANQCQVAVSAAAEAHRRLDLPMESGGEWISARRLHRDAVLEKLESRLGGANVDVVLSDWRRTFPGSRRSTRHVRSICANSHSTSVRHLTRRAVQVFQGRLHGYRKQMEADASVQVRKPRASRDHPAPSLSALARGRAVPGVSVLGWRSGCAMGPHWFCPLGTIATRIPVSRVQAAMAFGEQKVDNLFKNLAIWMVIGVVLMTVFAQFNTRQTPTNFDRYSVLEAKADLAIRR